MPPNCGVRDAGRKANLQLNSTNRGDIEMIRFSKVLTSLLASLLLNIALLTAPAAVAQRVAKANNVPDGALKARDLGPINAASKINIPVQLKLQNQDAFDKVVDALYDPASPTFHRW